ncbi:molybdopterin-dependent oxidoreductase [Acidovorax sp. M2(2025)]|uniref:molybdopterin-dependent oxidoreductase n=1 Tax=Acidovorax sp. M2(2025) TaxID=3411355 RepID=UPI003BF6087D
MSRLQATGGVAFELDGQPVTAQPGETILKAAQRHGVEIPHLCYTDGLRPDGNCRACVVEIAGERTLAPSCCRAPTVGMKVQAASPRARKSQQMVVEMLLSDMPDGGYRWNDDKEDAPELVAVSAYPSGAGGPFDSNSPEAVGQHGELSQWADRMGVAVRPALKALRREQPAPDLSHPAMAVNLDACIQCNRCVRACREEQVNDVIGYALRGAQSKIVFDLDDPMAESTCVACGECVQACPTGALSPKTHIGSQKVDRKVDSVCPFCGVGCLITYNVRDEKIISVEGRDGPANHGRLCVKGRFGFDYAHHPDRLTVPLVRKPGVPKEVRPYGADWRDTFREATWDEALDLAAGTLKNLRDTHGPKALAGFGSAKGSNEEAYLFQKLVRTGFGSNNVDHCTRLCHASSVAALLEGVGSGAVSNPVNDVEHAELIFVIGSNPTANHPVAATWMKNAAKRGARIVLADPRVTDIGRHAWRTLQFKADTDVAMLNALIHTVIDEGLVDEAFIKERTTDFEALKANVLACSPEAMAPVCSIPAETLREVARAFATAKSSMILWGMGVSQHVHGTDNARCLIALCAVTGQIGKPGSGLHPLRGQNNVQGASDAGLIPMMFPNYQRVDNAGAHAWFEGFWGTKLDEAPGYTVVEIMHKALAPDSDPHKVRGMYIMGENPAMSDPDLNHARHALASLQHLVVQDIFLTETAWLADVVLPASAWPEKTGTASNTDRMVQMGRRALNPPGDARPDLWIIQQIAQRVGPHAPHLVSSLPPEGAGPALGRPGGGAGLNWNYEGEESGVAAVYDEMRQAMHASIEGISWDRLERESSVTYPCLTPDDPGQPIVFKEQFPTPTGRLKLVPASVIPAAEKPDADYPLVLITGRQLEHWHTGSMTRRSTVLDAIEPMATASLHGEELARLGVAPGALVGIRSRRGMLQVRVRRDDGTPRGTVFMPFAYVEAAANLLTNAALDPFGKIPEFKYCAVAVEKLEAAAN